MTRIIELFEGHCKGKYPREFAKKFRNGFDRNNRVESAEDLFSRAKGYDFKDCFVSVYSFKQWSDEAEERKKNAVIDAVLFDLDCKDNLKTAFLEAKTLIGFLMKNDTMPRVYFSGSKGFHVIVDFKPIEVDFLAVRRTALKIIEALKLKTPDTAVLELSRVSRLPGTKNSNSGLYCVPLPLKFFEERFSVSDVVEFAKKPNGWIEVNESDWLRERIELEAEFLKHDSILRLLNSRKLKKFDSKRGKILERYITALKLYGRLTSDPEIAKRHNGNEHKARLFLNFLLIEMGHSDEEILEVFRLCNDFNERMASYQIKYNRQWLSRRNESPNSSRSSLTGEEKNYWRWLNE